MNTTKRVRKISIPLRVFVYCGAGHEMISVSASRPDAQGRAERWADEDGCGWVGCGQPRARTEIRDWMIPSTPV